jgi:hypothetical protein
MNNPHSLNYFKIETLFQNEDFSIRKWKWSHRLIIYKKNPRYFAVIAIHWNDCKNCYKDDLKKLYKFYLNNKKELWENK